MGTRAVSHIWFCWVMNVDSISVHGTPVVTPRLDVFPIRTFPNSKPVKPISCQAKLDAFLIIIIISSPAWGGEALNEESFHFQFTTFSHFRERRKIFLGARISCLCNCIYSLNTFVVGFIFSSFPPPVRLTCFVCLLSFLHRKRTKINGREKPDRWKCHFPSLFFHFSFFLLLQHLSYILNAPLGASGLRHHSHRLGLFLTIFFERILFLLLLSTGRHAGSICRIPSGTSKRPVKWEFRRATLSSIVYEPRTGWLST